MRIAIVDQHGNPGGGVRFVRALVEGPAGAYPGDEFGLFALPTVLASEPMRRLVAEHRNVLDEEIDVIAEVVGVSSEGLDDVDEGAAGDSSESTTQDDAEDVVLAPRGCLRSALREVAPLKRLYRRLRGLPAEPEPETPPPPSQDPTFHIDEELACRLTGYDAVYFAWPYFIEPIDLPVPVVATFHDFNFEHDFGNFAPDLIEILDRQISFWLQRVSATVVSTSFIGDELTSYYPDATRTVDVIPLASFVTSRPLPRDINEVIGRFELPDRYVLYPCNIAKHKNLVNMFKAYSLLKGAASDAPPLVLCGWGTDLIVQQLFGTIPQSDPYLEFLASELRSLRLEVGRDIYLLGYVSDAEVDALISGAALVVSPSTYEAGSGPALDAWLLGSPVALSSIPAHREQVERLETESWFFDPAGMARVIGQALRADTNEMVRRSAEALRRYNWGVVASQYHAVFERAVVSADHGSACPCE